MKSQERPLYFDNNATTPLDPRALAAMLPYLKEEFGNPESGQHSYGWKAEAAVAKARGQVAALIAAKPNEILFTSGATESLNLAILGFLQGLGTAPRHIISSVAEHKATLEVCARARQLGHEVTLLPVNRFAQVETRALIDALKPQTALVTLLHANNEVGSFNPIAEIGQALRAREGIAFHVDAAQTAGKEPIDVQAMGIDLLSMAAHKFYGPKGVGALYARRPAIHLFPVLVGGGQERGLRSGTHNVPGIVGFGEACALAGLEMAEERARLTRLRDHIIRTLATNANHIELNGHPTERVCNNVHLSIGGVPPDLVLTGLADIAFSTASACSGGTDSHVLKAMGRKGDDPMTSSMRFGLGRFTTEAEVETLIRRVLDVVQKGSLSK